MLALFACVAMLITAAAGVVMFLNIAIGADKADPSRLVRTVPPSPAKAAALSSVAKPTTPSVAAVDDPPLQKKAAAKQKPKKVAAKQKPKPRFAERSPGYSYPWGSERPYDHW